MRELSWRGEDDFGLALVGGDFAGEGDGLSGVAGEVAKLFRIVGEDDAGERAGLIVLTEVEEDGAGG